MAQGDELLFDAARRAVLSSLDEPEAITYRQDVLRDCLAHPEVIRQIYDLTVETLDGERRIWGGNSPSSFLYSSIHTFELFVPALRRLKHLSDEHLPSMRSEGLRGMLGAVAGELDEAYFTAVDRHMADLRFRDGVLLSARLGAGNKGTGYVLRRAPHVKQSWIRRIFERDVPPYSFEIAERDEPGAKALTELRTQGIVLVTNALRQSADHILGFLQTLQAELAFYIGCINAHASITRSGATTCFPVPVDAAAPALSADGLYDPCLTLRTGPRRRQQRPRGRRPVPRDGHRSEPGWEVDLPAQRRPGAAHVAVRHVRLRHVVPRRPLPWRLHALQAGGGCDDAEREARRGARPA